MVPPPAPSRRQALAVGTLAVLSLLASRAAAAEPPMASKKTSAVLLTTADLKLVHTLVKHTREFRHTPAHSVAFSPDGKLAAVSGCHLFAGVWDVASGKQVLPFTITTSGVAFRPTGEVVTASVGNEGVPGPFRMWTVGKKEPTELFTHRFQQVAMSADGGLLAGPTFYNRKPGDPDTAVLSTKDGKEVARAPYCDSLFAVTGDYFVTGKWPKEDAKGVWTLRVWGKDGKAVAEIEGAPPVAAGNADTLVLRGKDPAEVLIWNPAAKSKAVVKHGHAELTAVGLSADGKRLATAGPKEKPTGEKRYGISPSLVPQVVTVWNVDTGKKEATATVGEVAFRWLAFSPDGKQLLAAGSEDVMDR